MNPLNEIIRFFRSLDAPDHKSIVTEQRKERLSLRICELIGISEDKLFARTRKQEVINARRLYFYMTGEQRPCDLERRTGFDHSTVLYHKKNAVNFIETEKDYCKIANQLFREIREQKILM